MNAHHLRFVLRPYIEHKSRPNLRLQLATNVLAWLALLTVLAQVRWLGAAFVALSLAWWLFVDVGVVAIVGVASFVWLLVMPHGWGVVVAALFVFATTRVVDHFADVYHHEHADFLKDTQPSPVDTVREAVWGVFDRLLALLLQAGLHPELRAFLDAEERRVLAIREGVPWKNWAKLASCRAAFVSTPNSVDELVEAVREARARRWRVRVVASGFSWSSLAQSDEALIFCERLDRITVERSDPARPTVWAEAGVTNRQLNAELAKHALCMPWNVVLETVRVAGIASSGTHGTGKETSTVGDLVDAFEVVDASGTLRVLSEETIGAEGMSAARLSLGLFGVIARVKLRVAPMVRVSQTDHRIPIAAMLEQLPALIAKHDSVELYWFPFNGDAWVRTIDRTTEPRTPAGNGFWFRAQNFLQNVFAVLFFDVFGKWVPASTPLLLRIAMRMLSFRTRVMDLPESHHYRHWIEMMPAGCLEVGFKADPDCTNVRAAWRATERVVQAYASRGLYPLNLTLNVRFTGPSGALLTPAYGDGITCYVEIMWMGRPRGWAELSSELCLEWLKVPGALPHWSKEFEHVPGVVPIIQRHLGARRERFLALLAKSGIDPDGAFYNPVVRRVLAP